MKNVINDMLNQIEALKKPYGNSIFCACTEENCDRFMKWCTDHSYTMEDVNAFFEFSNKADGLNFNGLFVYSLNPNVAHNIYESNEEWWESEDLRQYLFFADDDVSWYCFDTTKSVYWVLDKPSGEQIESFNTMEGLLVKVLETALQ